MQLGYNMCMKCDCLIVGAGPAGLSASIFTLRAGLKTICVEALGVGGQAALSYEIANYPGFESISGFDLTERMRHQAESLGLKIVYGAVIKLEREKNHFIARLKDETITAKKVILACGSKVRKLGLKNEEKLIGRGISFCASCDGGFYRDKTVAVVGGGNTAIEDVNYLSHIASKIYLIHRSETFKANKVDVDKIKKLKNVEIITSANVVELKCKDRLQSITIDRQGEKLELQVDGLFEAIGYVPDIQFVDFELGTDEAGYIKVNKNMQTSVKNCYAAGDIVSKNFRQVITACADGATAGNSCVGVK